MQTGRNKPLHHMFTVVPPRYDLINHVITLGLDRLWRGKAAGECLKAHPHKVLDLGCGTGDLAIKLARLAGKKRVLTGIDYSQPMLEIATSKAKASGRDISFIHGDAASLPFPDGCFDCVGISFAFRNLTYKNPLTQNCLAEVRRVLTVGGRFVIVETSQPESKLMRKLCHLYLRWIVSRVGHWLSGNKGAYHYLAESATSFFTAEEVETMLMSAGFRRVSFRPLFFGAVGIHVAVK
jgi:demethylmenaquinone methyltransferase/2-methoxy-6-polyprenyl-1,4-benzoquinol methylase